MTWRGRSKLRFGNHRTEVDGYRFDSKKEARRYQELKLLEKAGAIHLLVADKKQLRYELKVNGMKICDYVADFCYIENGLPVVEDCKGFKTPEYRLKKKLMLACYSTEIRET